MRILLLLTFLSLLLVPASAQDYRYVSVPVAEVHRHASSGSEQVTQALLWERIQVLEERGSWAKVLVSDQYRTDKGYPGWMLRAELQKSDKPRSWVLVSAAKTGIRKSADYKKQPAHWAYLGTRIALADNQEPSTDWFRVQLPGSPETYFISRKHAVEVNSIERAKEGAPLVETASQLKGVPYVWGGMCQKGIDCSGLTFQAYRRHGYAIPRDADQQATFGVAVDPSELVAGDLLFFGKSLNDITHVGMYIGDGRFIHASSSLGGVTVSRFDEPQFQARFQTARRILK